jgi:hypothetical protein
MKMVVVVVVVVVAVTQEFKGFLITELNKNKSNITGKGLVMIYREVLCGWNTQCENRKERVRRSLSM